MYSAATTIILVTSFITSNAFTAPSSVKRASALRMAFDDELGVINPTGFWDPLQLTKDMDEQVR
jgi:hypothetical protein